MNEYKKMRKNYRTTNWAQYNATLKARGYLTMWLDRAMQWHTAPSGKLGRSQFCSDAAIELPPVTHIVKFLMGVFCYYQNNDFIIDMMLDRLPAGVNS